MDLPPVIIASQVHPGTLQTKEVSDDENGHCLHRRRAPAPVPTFIIGSAAAAMGDQVILFFTPAAAPALVKGELETVEGKGVPEMGELVASLQDLAGLLLVCDLCAEAVDIQEADLRAGAEIVGVTIFLAETRDATRTFSF